MKKEENVINKIYEYALADILEERFGAYSKYVIQDRAIPDARDGLKPVQRRILYGMFDDGNTSNRAYRKAANAVGYVMGRFHPHGDSSIYEALVRMSQDWKNNAIYIDMQGNNGSIDGDPPAAYRYTEVRLTKLSEENLKDLNRNTVEMAPTFDDAHLEPTVLPFKYPNLLVNGSSGISSGYATNIPPHNLGEVIDGTIYRIHNSECTLDEMLKIIPGPDFPTGAIASDAKTIKKAYETGKGKIKVRARYSIDKNKIIISEIPFEVNKALLLKRIDEIRISKNTYGITEVRDESDKNGIRIVIEIKKDRDAKTIINYLYKNSDLQVNYNYNAVAIVNNHPKNVGVLEMLDAYINHDKEVIIRRTKFDLAFALKRKHIVEGLVKVLSILDEVIKLIRASKNKSDAKENLVKEFDFTMEQAEAIVMLELYRLTNTDVLELTNELKRLNKTIKALEKILNDENVLKELMISELKYIKETYSTNRKTTIEEEEKEININIKKLIPEEKVIVTLSKDGYLKKSSFRSFMQTEEITLKDNDYLILNKEATTLNTLIIFTSLGNYIYLPVINISTKPYKDMGVHLSNLIPLEVGEEVVSSFIVPSFKTEDEITLISKEGLIKNIKIKDLEVKRYSKTFVAMKLSKNDRLINAIDRKDNVIINTKDNMVLRFKTSEISTLGLNAKGIIGIKLNKGDEVVSINSFNEEDLFLLCAFNNGTLKRLKLSDIKEGKRTNKGIKVVSNRKTNPYILVKALIVNSKTNLGILSDSIKIIKASEVPIKTLDSGASLFSKTIEDIFIIEDDASSEDISLDDVDEAIKNASEVLKKTNENYQWEI